MTMIKLAQLHTQPTYTSHGQPITLPKHMDTFKFIKPLPIFAEIQDSSLQLLANDIMLRHFAQGETIFREGDPGRVLYIVKSGQVRIFVSGAGQETSIILCGRPGDIFGELAIVDGLPRSATAAAVEETTVYMLDRDLFRDHMRRDPQLALNFMKLLTVRVRYNTKQVNSLASLSVSSRLARLLLTLAHDYGQMDKEGVRINTSLTQTDLASLIGATRESTNKALSTFRRLEYIRQTDGHWLVVDPEALRKLVSTDE